VNFGPHLLELLEGTREVLQATQILWPKYKNKKVMMDQILMMTPIFSKLVNFGLSYLENALEF